MMIELKLLPLPANADASKFTQFGREVFGVDPSNLTSEQFEEIREALYKHDVLVFRNAALTPKQQYALTKAFDPASEKDGHKERTKKSLLGPFIPIPSVPQVQLIGNGTVYDHEGIEEAKLKHRSHKTFHKTIVSPEDEAAGATRFYRWDIDAALYEISPPRVTTLYGLRIPAGPRQVCRYDDGTGDELPVPLAATAFVSSKTMLALLPLQLKSLAIRARVKYAPHPYVWMTPAHAKSTGLGMESEGLEVAYSELPAWKEEKRKILPMVHGCGAAEILIDPLPADAVPKGALYPDGAHLMDLEEVRKLLYKMQRPAIVPQFVYPYDWHENDLILFNNGGVMQSVVGALGPDQIRMFHQCNLAGSDDPAGPSAEDVRKWA
ncbi:Clavaminate synthase-like protein [Mycena vulgaris]|nr:Clavaminate synthase-like protein [Mycena vulgaris]